MADDRTVQIRVHKDDYKVIRALSKKRRVYISQIIHEAVVNLTDGREE